jgi:putative Holliday junction resolvase
MKILAIDYGTKRMGFAIGNTLHRTANPLAPLTCKGPKHDITHIAHLVSQYDVETIVMGYPLHMDGTRSDISRKVDIFKEKLQRKLQVDVKLVDERLSSMEAESILAPLEKDFMKRKKALDSMAAVVILKDFMETQ